MSPFEETLERLGLSEYTRKFITEGFDSWQTLSDIKESDLDQLHVKLGHRRKLQRAIAESGHEAKIEGSAFRSSGYNVRSEQTSNEQGPHRSSSRSLESGAGAPRAKRRYKRHAKADPNAPERPSSAYVLFSNQMRIDLKSLDLGFTEMAKAVGERWQSLASEERESYESEAAAQKAKFHDELSAYKTTADYTQYEQYLAEFKAKERSDKGGAPSETKKTKLHHETSIESHESHESRDSEVFSHGNQDSATSPYSIASTTTSDGQLQEYPSKASTPATAQFASAGSTSSSRDHHIVSPTSATIPRPPSSNSKGNSYRTVSYGATYSAIDSSAPPGYAPFAPALSVSSNASFGHYGRSGHTSPTSPPGTFSAMNLNGSKSERTLPPPVPSNNRMQMYGHIPLISMPPSRTLPLSPMDSGRHRLNELVAVATNEINKNEGR